MYFILLILSSPWFVSSPEQHGWVNSVDKSLHKLYLCVAKAFHLHLQPNANISVHPPCQEHLYFRIWYEGLRFENTLNIIQIVADTSLSDLDSLFPGSHLVNVLFFFSILLVKCFATFINPSTLFLCIFYVSVVLINIRRLRLYIFAVA